MYKHTKSSLLDILMKLISFFMEKKKNNKKIQEYLTI